MEALIFVSRFGYVPNGNRVYYLNRSQPPLLTWCLAAYYEATGDKEFVLVGARWFEREYEFFRSHKYVILKNHRPTLFVSAYQGRRGILSGGLMD